MPQNPPKNRHRLRLMSEMPLRDDPGQSGFRWPEPIAYKDRSGNSRQFTQQNARALADTLASVLHLRDMPKDISAVYNNRPNVKGWTLQDVTDGSSNVTLGRNQAMRVPEVLAHEMAHTGQGVISGSHYTADPVTLSDLKTHKRLRDISYAAVDLPDTLTNMLGSPVGETGGSIEKFPEVVSRAYGAIERAGNVYRPHELDAQRDSVQADIKRLPLLRDMLEVFVGSPEYERMRYLLTPKLPSGGVADAVRRR